MKNAIYCVIYRTGGTENFEWKRSACGSWTATRMLWRTVKRQGYKAYVATAKDKLPTTFRGNEAFKTSTPTYRDLIEVGDILTIDNKGVEATVIEVYKGLGVKILTQDNCAIPFSFEELESRNVTARKPEVKA